MDLHKVLCVYVGFGEGSKQYASVQIGDKIYSSSGRPVVIEDHYLPRMSSKTCRPRWHTLK